MDIIHSLYSQINSGDSDILDGIAVRVKTFKQLENEYMYNEEIHNPLEQYDILRVEHVYDRVKQLSLEKMARAITITYKPEIQNVYSIKQMRNILAHMMEVCNIKEGILVYDVDDNQNYHYHGTIVCTIRETMNIKKFLQRYIGFNKIVNVTDAEGWATYVTKYIRLEEQQGEPVHYDEILLFKHKD